MFGRLKLPYTITTVTILNLVSGLVVCKLLEELDVCYDTKGPDLDQVSLRNIQLNSILPFSKPGSKHRFDLLVSVEQ